MTSFPVAAILLIGFTFVLTAGVRIAVYRQARSDYRDAKAKVPGARKVFWESWRAAAIACFWIAVGALVLAAWVAHDVREQVSNPRPSISTKAS